MKGVAFWFVALAAVSFLVAMILGIIMGATEDFSLSPAHAHLNLLGGVMGMLFGIHLHVIGAIGRLPWLLFATHWAGAWLTFPALILIIQGRPTQLIAVASTLMVVSVVLFALVHVMAARRAAG